MAFIPPTPLRPAAPKLRPLSPRRPPSASLPPRVIPAPLPNVLVYDHCPFCIRVRLVLGAKNVKFNLTYLANDDVDSPTALVGCKIVPIFQPHGLSGSAYCESLDICKLIDSDERYGKPGLVRPKSDRTDFRNWMDDTAMPMRRLTRVRFARATLPEFAFRDGREAYLRNHALKDPDSYEENFERSEEWIAMVQPKLDSLADMIFCKEFCTEGGFSYDDVELFPKLRSMSIIKGLVLPPRIREYVEFQAENADIPLYDYCAM